MADSEGMPRLSRKRARTRADLLAAARSVFATRGYHEASIAEITGAADVGVGTFYLHFRDKDEIFSTLIEEGLHAIRERVTAAALQHPLEQLLPAVVRLSLYHAYEERDLFRIALTSGSQLMRRFQAQAALVEGLHLIFEMAQAQGLLAEFESPLLAQFIAGIVTHAIVWWFEHDEPGPDVMTEQVMLLLRHGLPAQLLVEESTR